MHFLREKKKQWPCVRIDARFMASHFKDQHWKSDSNNVRSAISRWRNLPRAFRGDPATFCRVLFTPKIPHTCTARAVLQPRSQQFVTTAVCKLLITWYSLLVATKHGNGEHTCTGVWSIIARMEGFRFPGNEMKKRVHRMTAPCTYRTHVTPPARRRLRVYHLAIGAYDASDIPHCKTCLSLSVCSLFLSCFYAVNAASEIPINVMCVWVCMRMRIVCTCIRHTHAAS